MLPLILFALVSTATPGPNNIMMLASGLNFGIRRSLPHWLGICIGVPIMLFAFGFGLEQLFHLMPAAFLVLKILGISYLVFLAYKIARAQPMQKLNNPNKATAAPLSFWQAVLFQWVNPKAWVMCLTAIPAFTSTEQALLPQVSIIAATFCLVGLLGVGAWLFTGSQIQRLLKKPKQQQMFNLTMAALLVVSIVPMVQS